VVQTTTCGTESGGSSRQLIPKRDQPEAAPAGVRDLPIISMTKRLSPRRTRHPFDPQDVIAPEGHLTFGCLAAPAPRGCVERHSL
jgi:hypothetical protein